MHIQILDYGTGEPYPGEDYYEPVWYYQPPEVVLQRMVLQKSTYSMENGKIDAQRLDRLVRLVHNVISDKVSG